MLRTAVALSIVCLVAAVAGTAVTGLFWVSLVAVAGVLVFGATALTLVRMPDDDEEAAVVGAEVRPLASFRRAPGAVVPGRDTDRRSRAA